MLRRSIGGRPLYPADIQFERLPVPNSGEDWRHLRWVACGMPKLDKYAEILRTVFFLYETEEDALAGTNSGGTGFLVAFPSETHGPDVKHVHAITNWHVAVFNEDGPPAPVVRINRIGGGKPIILPFDPSEWVFKPRSYDVAVSPPILEVGDWDANYLDTTSWFLTSEQEKSEEVGPAEDVFMVGRFVDYEGVETTSPAVRFGHISILSADIAQHSGYIGRSIVLDMHSRSGFSGSPVFVYRTLGSHFLDPAPPGHFLTGGGHFIKLLGMHWGQFPELWELKDRSAKATARRSGTLVRDGQYIEGLSGMTCVVPAAQIMEVLKLPELQKMRAKIEEEVLKKLVASGRISGPKPESKKGKDDDANPNHQEDFKRLLGAAVKSPKSSG